MVTTSEGSAEIPMIADEAGWFQIASDTLGASGHTRDPQLLRYGFLLDDSTRPLPDPRSARQPDGVHGLSALHTVDDAIWHDAGWAGRDIRGAVLYELHVGTFTADGTLDSAIDRLGELVDLGVEAVEVMPLNAFNGTHNWGYDGVGWYAVHEPYGGPDAFARFVDACHTRGLAVVLDVVYNHLGPSGNYLPDFGPYLGAGSTGWGASMNLDGPDSDEVRRFILENALRWFAEFHVDALRLDAVHALVDRRAYGLLEALAVSTEALAATLGRPLSLIAESDLNDPRLVEPRVAGGLGLTAQWDDDIHHAIHTIVSGERQGYYADFGSYPGLAKVLCGGFFHDGTYSSFRRRHHGRPIPESVPTTALVAYTCDHDQIGNRALGDRPSAYLDHGQLAIKAALVLLSPFTPMLFMGEEWAATTPFQYFTSHPEPELGAATRDGRQAEFAEHGWHTGDVPDPQDPRTFERSKLDWAEPGHPDHARVRRFYRDLITLRKHTAAFARGDFASVAVDYDEAAGWFAMHRGDEWSVVCVLADHPVPVGIAMSVTHSWEATESVAGGVLSPGHNVFVGRRQS
ncbi:malto-oligosyltrehalose trehalohydrolase [Gordonia sp. DT219]|uniref:malto-oligosyltrehalose trehalohydrolase n=1 Tax=Gordonia sp. DT219 TaxID=3416658 RepID=UPI003CE87799